MIHFEILPYETTVDSEKNCEQLELVKKNIEGKFRKVYFLHDNARPHVSNQTRKKILGFDWTILPHPPYFPRLISNRLLFI